MYASTHKMWRQPKSGKEADEGEEGGGKSSQRLADDLSENIFHIT